MVNKKLTLSLSFGSFIAVSIADDLVSLQTDGIVGSAGPVLVDEEAENRYMWGYYLCIENNTPKKR
mgnify:CR=1 FL=1